jgi:hypothetical protein
MATVRFQPGQARHLERVVEGLADRAGGIHEHGFQSRFRGQVGDQACTDDGFDAGRLQVFDGGARILARDVGALRNIDAEGLRELGQLRQRLLVMHDADPGRQAARPRQRLHHVEAAGLGDDQGHRHPSAQVGRIRAGGNDDVAMFARQAVADVAGGLVEPQVQRLDVGQVVVFEGNVAEQFRQARHGHRPDDGFAGRDGGGRGGRRGGGLAHPGSVVHRRRKDCRKYRRKNRVRGTP